MEYLADSALLTPDQLSSILAQLPSATTLEPAAAVHEPPTEAFNNLGVTESNNHNGHYAPSPQPERQQATPNPNPDPVSTMPPPPAYPVAPVPPPPQVEPLTYATALYAYKPTDAYDLELFAGESIAVTEYMNGEWWKGRSQRTGAEGIFPRNYVRVEEKAPAPYRETNYGNVPVQVAYGAGPSDAAPVDPKQPSKGQEYGKKFGKKLGNAAIFGAGATIGGNIVNGIF